MILYIIIMSLKYRKKDSFINLVFILILAMLVVDTATIDWDTHLSSYWYILVFCLLRTHITDYKLKNEK